MIPHVNHAWIHLESNSFRRRSPSKQLKKKELENKDTNLIEESSERNMNSSEYSVRIDDSHEDRKSPFDWVSLRSLAE